MTIAKLNKKHGSTNVSKASEYIRSLTPMGRIELMQECGSKGTALMRSRKMIDYVLSSKAL